MNTRKIFITLIMMNIFQILITAAVVVVTFAGERPVWAILVYISAFFTVFNAFITLLAFNMVNRAKNTSLIESINNLEKLNTTLREQRHDYLNHIQVIYGLMQLEEYGEAKKYLEPVFREIKKVSMAMKTAQPAVNALLQAKLQMAEKQQVTMYLYISTDLKHLKIEPWELCKVLSNLIDNAITALSGKRGMKEIHIEMSENAAGYHFKIMNNGPQIPRERQKKIFEEGYTTKKEAGHGMGLFIVSSILKEAGGSISVASDEEGTCFDIQLDRMKVEEEKVTLQGQKCITRKLPVETRPLEK